MEESLFQLLVKLLNQGVEFARVEATDLNLKRGLA